MYANSFRSKSLKFSTESISLAKAGVTAQKRSGKQTQTSHQVNFSLELKNAFTSQFHLPITRIIQRRKFFFHENRNSFHKSFRLTKARNHRAPFPNGIKRRIWFQSQKNYSVQEFSLFSISTSFSSFSRSFGTEVKMREKYYYQRTASEDTEIFFRLRLDGSHPLHLLKVITRNG